MVEADRRGCAGPAYVSIDCKLVKPHRDLQGPKEEHSAQPPFSLTTQLQAPDDGLGQDDDDQVARRVDGGGDYVYD